MSAAALTDVGRTREHNEDAWFMDPPVFVVADGMGGHDAGDLASSAVVDAFASLAGSERITIDDVESCVRAAQVHVDRLTAGDRGAPGSTVVLAALTERDGLPVWIVANVGDSRAYVWCGGRLEQVSTDHSLVQELLDAGEIDEAQAAHHPDRHVITRAIGAFEQAVAEYVVLPVEAGSRVLLCSDGLTSEVPDDLIGDVLAAAPDAAAAVRELVELALSRGGRDNVTAVVVDVEGSSELSVDTLPDIARIDEDTVRTFR